MNLSLLIAAGVYGIFLFFAVVFVARRLLRRMRGKGFRPSGGACGDAMQRLQIFGQPEVRFVVERKQSENVEEEGQGGPPDK